MAVEVHSGSKTFTFHEGTSVHQQDGHLFVTNSEDRRDTNVATFAPRTWDYAYKKGSAEVDNSVTAPTTPDRGHIAIDPSTI